jgi:hypothetical protein
MRQHAADHARAPCVNKSLPVCVREGDWRGAVPSTDESGPLLTMEVLRRLRRARAVIREHVCPGNWSMTVGGKCPCMPARVLADAPVSYLRLVVCSQNARRIRMPPKSPRPSLRRDRGRERRGLEPVTAGVTGLARAVKIVHATTREGSNSRRMSDALGRGGDAEKPPPGRFQRSRGAPDAPELRRRPTRCKKRFSSRCRSGLSHVRRRHTPTGSIPKM